MDLDDVYELFMAEFAVADVDFDRCVVVKPLPEALQCLLGSIYGESQSTGFVARELAVFGIFGE